MKYLVRVFLFNVFALWLTSQLVPGITISGGWQMMLIAGLVLSLLMLVVAPILRILFIPINILTFGLVSWFINVIVLFLLTILLPQVTITAWTYQGLSFAGFVVPSLIISYPISLIGTSLFITFFSNFLHRVSED